MTSSDGVLVGVERRFAQLCESGPVSRVRIERGTIHDYDTLSPLHYRAGRPMTWPVVLRAVDPLEPFRSEPGQGVDRGTCRGGLAGVLVVSTPVLNGPWRELAWPGRYRGRDRRAVARQINQELRVISRVVVDPRWRGVGLATALVRAYLDAPITPATEALAVMGIACPFFASAGMTEYRMPPRPADARLMDACEHAGIRPDRLAQACDRAVAPRWLQRELVHWARSSLPAQRLADGPVGAIARLAVGRVLARPVAYAHSSAELPPNTSPPQAEIAS